MSRDWWLWRIAPYPVWYSWLFLLFYIMHANLVVPLTVVFLKTMSISLSLAVLGFKKWMCLCWSDQKDLKPAASWVLFPYRFLPSCRSFLLLLCFKSYVNPLAGQSAAGTSHLQDWQSSGACQEGTEVRKALQSCDHVWLSLLPCFNALLFFFLSVAVFWWRNWTSMKTGTETLRRPYRWGCCHGNAIKTLNLDRCAEYPMCHVWCLILFSCRLTPPACAHHTSLWFRIYCNVACLEK